MKTYIVINLATGKAVKSFPNDYHSAREFMERYCEYNWYLVELEINEHQTVKELDGCAY